MAKGWGREEDFDAEREDAALAPAPRSAYITAEGYARLRAEYDQLWRERRPEVVKALSAAAAEGDRSENAEYIYRKKELREIDRRVRYLQTRLPVLKVVAVDAAIAASGKVRFGATVTLIDEDGAEQTLRIVGADEIGPASNVSVDAPLARALIGKAAGDVVSVTLPAGRREYEVLVVSYLDDSLKAG